MSRALRLGLLALACLSLLPGLVAVGQALPAFGGEVPPYGLLINALAPQARHVSNMVSAINFDIRGLDTLGEEFMLLAAVTGAVVLLRGNRGESRTDKAVRIPGRGPRPASDATVLVCRAIGGVLAVYGIYVVLHATVTPGGGFQGGVILASGTLLVYLGEGYPAWRDLLPSAALDAVEGGGALAFAFCGLGPMLAGGAFLENLLPLGQIGSLTSGGLMLLANLGVAGAVTGGFCQLALEFMEETRAPEGDEDA